CCVGGASLGSDPVAAAVFFFSSRRRHTRSKRDWSSDVCSSDLPFAAVELNQVAQHAGRGRVSGDARGGLPGAQQRAGVHGLDAEAGEKTAKCPGLRKPVRAQRQVQALPQTQLLACRSVRLRVANQVDELFGHGDCPPFKIRAPPMPWGRRLAKRLLTDAPRTYKII